MLRKVAFVVFVCLCVVPHVVAAGGQSLFGGANLGAARGSLLGGGQVVATRKALVPIKASLNDGGTGSLFAGRNTGTLLAPVMPKRAQPNIGAFSPYIGGPVAQLRSLIASAEAGRKGYDAVQHGARVKPPKSPTRMTIREIYAWIDATPGQPHAIGRYQFIPKTLRRLVKQLGVSETAMFSPQVQDLLGDRLLEDAGLSKFLRGKKSQTAFMNDLAKIWAGLPNSSGKSHYHGYAGNHATMSWSRFKSEMSRIFPTT